MNGVWIETLKGLSSNSNARQKIIPLDRRGTVVTCGWTGTDKKLRGLQQSPIHRQHQPSQPVLPRSVANSINRASGLVN